MDYLSDIELYYSLPENCEKEIILTGDEFKHAFRVMRHRLGDILFITNGEGKIFSAKIVETSKEQLILSPEKTLIYINNFNNIHFCLPKLKNPERFEFAIEKCVELGITNFLIFESERTISASSKLERWNKIALSAMKQSLRSFLPKISLIDSVQSINELAGEKIIFDQKSEKQFSKFERNPNYNYYFLFGPEGGFTDKEIQLFNKQQLFKLAENRLRSETAIIKCASML